MTIQRICVFQHDRFSWYTISILFLKIKLLSTHLSGTELVTLIGADLLIEIKHFCRSSRQWINY
jgi:hypothetical protein